MIKSSANKDLIKSKLIETTEQHRNNVNDRIEPVLRVMKTYKNDFEQDFKPWTDRIEAPIANQHLEELIQSLHSSVNTFNDHLELNKELRQCILGINQVTFQGKQ